MTTDRIEVLADLRGHRSAPPLTKLQRIQLLKELRKRAAACDWFTIGIMAPAPEVALACLQSFEGALGWPHFAAIDPAEISAIDGPVFLKGYQRTGKVAIRAEEGLGEGVLLTGHSDSDPEVEDTWGPLPLDLFSVDSPLPPERGATGL